MPVILMLKILITGGAGFIGSHIADLFIKNNHDVIIMDNLANGNKNNINSKAKFYEADILDNLDEIFKKGKFDVVVHHAALIEVVESKSKPESKSKSKSSSKSNSNSKSKPDSKSKSNSKSESKSNSKSESESKSKS